jgi:AmiR/NasT family two-component response regulator
MIDLPHPLLEADEARLAAAAGVVMDSLGLEAPEAFTWITEASGLTGISDVDLADLVVLEAARAGLRGEQFQGRTSN